MEKETGNRKWIFIILVVLLIGFVGLAYAHRSGNPGYFLENTGNHGMSHEKLKEHGHMSTGLTDEQIKKLNEQRQSFLSATEDLRQKMVEKELELERELVKKSPDSKNATRVRKELSELEAEYDQMWITHIIEMKRINPLAKRKLTMARMSGGNRGYCGHSW